MVVSPGQAFQLIRKINLTRQNIGGTSKLLPEPWTKKLDLLTETENRIRGRDSYEKNEDAENLTAIEG
jgi:hypothetical protein